jgi:hypothetical protein
MRRDEQYRRATDERSRLSNMLVAPPNEFARRNLNRKMASVQLKVNLIDHELSRCHSRFLEAQHVVVRLMADLKGFLLGLPASSERLDLTTRILDLPIVQTGGWTGGPWAPFEAGLSKLASMLRELQPLLTESQEALAEWRKTLLRQYLKQPNRSVKQICDDAHVDAADFSRWRNGKLKRPSQMSERIEDLLLLGPPTDDSSLLRFPRPH